MHYLTQDSDFNVIFIDWALTMKWLFHTSVFYDLQLKQKITLVYATSLTPWLLEKWTCNLCAGSHSASHYTFTEIVMDGSTLVFKTMNETC